MSCGLLHYNVHATMHERPVTFTHSFKHKLTSQKRKEYE